VSRLGSGSAQCREVAITGSLTTKGRQSPASLGAAARSEISLHTVSLLKPQECVVKERIPVSSSPARLKTA